MQTYVSLRQLVGDSDRSEKQPGRRKCCLFAVPRISAIPKYLVANVPPFQIGSPGVHGVRIAAVITAALLLSNDATATTLACAPSSTFRFALPGGAAILYGKASNPQSTSR